MNRRPLLLFFISYITPAAIPVILRIAVSLRRLTNERRHCCPVKSRTESTGCRDRVILLGSPILGGPVKWGFFQKA
jgi:hypothetical protein